MKIRNVAKLNDFLAIVDSCEGQVWLGTQNGDQYSLTSLFSQYLAMDLLLTVRSDYLELSCTSEKDEKAFRKYLKLHSELTA